MRNTICDCCGAAAPPIAEGILRDPLATAWTTVMIDWHFDVRERTFQLYADLCSDACRAKWIADKLPLYVSANRYPPPKPPSPEAEAKPELQ
jgi:hypothetical protein